MHHFFTTRFSTATIVIDVKTATVFEHRLSRGLLDEESVESFRDYVVVRDGCAKRSLRIRSGGQGFRLTIRFYGDKLRLLAGGFYGEEQHPAISALTKAH